VLGDQSSLIHADELNNHATAVSRCLILLVVALLVVLSSLVLYAAPLLSVLL